MINLKSMRKKIIVFLFLFALPVLVLGAFQPATLTNGVDRVAVFTSEQAQNLFAQGYELEQAIGSAAGNLFTKMVYFNRGFVKGGKTLVASTTLTVARTLTAAEVCNNKTIKVNTSAVAGTLSEASLDLTVAGTSTLFTTCLKAEGDEVEFDLVNASPTAATTTELVAGTGCQIVYGVADGDATIPGQKGATVNLKRIYDWTGTGGAKDCVMKVYEWN